MATTNIIMTKDGHYYVACSDLESSPMSQRGSARLQILAAASRRTAFKLTELGKTSVVLLLVH